MKRLHIRHCRDSAVLPEYRWELWCTDTGAPWDLPLFVGYGSWVDCIYVSQMLTAANRNLIVFHFTGFESKMTEV